jgi:hypothetical protein
MYFGVVGGYVLVRTITGTFVVRMGPLARARAGLLHNRLWVEMKEHRAIK